MRLTLYHRTSNDAADSILRDGFRDGIGNYLTSNTYSGVWLANEPVDENEGAFGDVLLRIEIDLPPTIQLAEYEWRGLEPRRFREFLIPADIVNRYGIISVEDVRPPLPDWAHDGWELPTE